MYYLLKSVGKLYGCESVGSHLTVNLNNIKLNKFYINFII